MGKKTFCAVSALVAVVLTLGAGAALAVSGSVTEEAYRPSAVAIVNGEEIPIEKGTVLASRVSETGCVIRMRGNGYYNYGHVRVEFNEERGLVVTELTFQHRDPLQGILPYGASKKSTLMETRPSGWQTDTDKDLPAE